MAAKPKQKYARSPEWRLAQSKRMKDRHAAEKKAKRDAEIMEIGRRAMEAFAPECSLCGGNGEGIYGSESPCVQCNGTGKQPLPPNALNFNRPLPEPAEQTMNPVAPLKITTMLDGQEFPSAADIAFMDEMTAPMEFPAPSQVEKAATDIHTSPTSEGIWTPTPPFEDGQIVEFPDGKHYVMKTIPTKEEKDAREATVSVGPEIPEVSQYFKINPSTMNPKLYEQAVSYAPGSILPNIPEPPTYVEGPPLMANLYTANSIPAEERTTWAPYADDKLDKSLKEMLKSVEEMDPEADLFLQVKDWLVILRAVLR